MSPDHRDALRELVAQALAAPSQWPARAFAREQALLVYATDALFAYYLGVDGRVFVHDMDRFMGGLDPIDDPATIREVYRRAGEEYPDLAGITP